MLFANKKHGKHIIHCTYLDTKLINKLKKTGSGHLQTFPDKGTTNGTGLRRPVQYVWEVLGHSVYQCYRTVMKCHENIFKNKYYLIIGVVQYMVRYCMVSGTGEHFINTDFDFTKSLQWSNVYTVKTTIPFHLPCPWLPQDHGSESEHPMLLLISSYSCLGFRGIYSICQQEQWAQHICG